MVVRTSTRENPHNPLKDLPGYKQVIAAVLDATDRKDGELPTQVTIELSEEELRDAIAAFRPNHFTRKGTRVTLYPPRIARDEFNDRPDALLQTWYADQRRAPRRLRAEYEQRRRELWERIQALPDHPARKALLGDLDEGTGWITALLGRKGVDLAANEATAVVTAIARLPLPAPTRIKVFANKTLGSSHRLDAGTPTYNHVADFLIELDPSTDATETHAEDRRAALEDNNLVLNLTHPKALVSGRLMLAFGKETDARVVRNKERGLATAFTLQELLKAAPSPPLPSTIISVENEDPFNDLTSLAPPDVLLVYTGGHLSAATRALLSHPHLNRVPRIHWGDVDAGGFRILQSLPATPPPTPILMDEASVRADPKRLTKLDPPKRNSILRYQPNAPSAYRGALQACLDLDGYLEQEAIPPEDALLAIKALLHLSSTESL